MRKLKYILLLLIAISCTKEVEVLNPINAENVKKIAELQSQLSSLTSSLSGLQSQNQNLTNERNSLQEQLTSLQSQLSTLEDTNASLESQLSTLQETITSLGSQLSASEETNASLASLIKSLESQLSTTEETNTSLESQITALEDTNTSLESQIESLKIKVAELGLAVAFNVGVQDGVYTLISSYYLVIASNNDTISGNGIFNTNNISTINYGLIEDGRLKKRTRDADVDIYDDSSNKVTFKQWLLREGMGDIQEVNGFKDSIYVSNIDEIITEYQVLQSYNQVSQGITTYIEDATAKSVSKWKLNRDLTEETVPAQTFLEINKFIRENSTVGTFSDSIYKNIDPFDPISLREGFILDAQRNGLDISYLRDEEITLETVDWNYGAAYGSPCRTGVIKVYREQEWEQIIRPLSNSALWVMFHEMGHAALNLQHNQINGDIMSVVSDFSLEKLRDATRRMFQNIEQISYGCGFATQKGGGTIIVD